jgi:capsular polysaccharide biosynthesis protein
MSALARAAYARLGALSPDAARPREAKIYIDRSGAPYRRLPNEAALIAALSARGFVPVRLEELSFAQQVALFRHASMVVGLHGAGLANIAFCSPGTVVYELVAENYRNPCYLAMAMNAGLDYWADVFASGGGLNDYQGGWAADIDIALVMRRLAQLEAFVLKK